MMIEFIEPEQMEVGTYITIFKSDDGDKSFLGDVLEIKAVNLPYLIVLHHDDDSIAKMTLDTRDRTFMKPSEEYVKACMMPMIHGFNDKA